MLRWRLVGRFGSVRSVSSSRRGARWFSHAGKKGRWGKKPRSTSSKSGSGGRSSNAQGSKEAEGQPQGSLLSFGKGRPTEHVIFKLPKGSVTTMRQIGWGATLVPGSVLVLALAYWSEPLWNEKTIAAVARMEQYGPLHGQREDGTPAAVDTAEVGKAMYGEPGHVFDRADFATHVKHGAALQNALLALTVACYLGAVYHYVRRMNNRYIQELALLPHRRLRITTVGLRNSRSVVVPLDAVVAPRGALDRLEYMGRVSLSQQQVARGGQAADPGERKVPEAPEASSRGTPLLGKWIEDVEVWGWRPFGFKAEREEQERKMSLHRPNQPLDDGLTLAVVLPSRGGEDCSRPREGVEWLWERFLYPGHRPGHLTFKLNGDNTELRPRSLQDQEFRRILSNNSTAGGEVEYH